MRVLLLILAALSFFLGASPTLAVSVTISNLPAAITDEPFIFNVTVSGASAGTNYLRVDLYKEGSNNYFGETYSNSDWYNGSDGKQYLPITILSGQVWSGLIQARVGIPTTTEYLGPGIYKLKVRRYTGSGNPASNDQQTPQDITISLTISTPTPSPSLSPSPSPTTSPSTFTISNTPSQIDSTETFNTNVTIALPKHPNTVYYLKGSFKKTGGTNYFGLTKVANNWIRNSLKYDSQYQITTDGSGIWSGQIEVQPDILDSGYEGAGKYAFKIGRYGTDGSLSWSNEADILINAQGVVLEKEDDNNILGVEETAAKKDNSFKDNSFFDEEDLLEKSPKTTANKVVLASPTAKIEVARDENRINLFSTLGGLLIIIGAISIGYVYYKRRENL